MENSDHFQVGNEIGTRPSPRPAQATPPGLEFQVSSSGQPFLYRVGLPTSEFKFVSFQINTVLLRVEGVRRASSHPDVCDRRKGTRMAPRQPVQGEVG